MKRMVLFLSVVLVAGCATVPFKPIEPVPMEGLQPETVRRRFAGQLPREFEIMNSVVFSFHFMKFSGMGPLRWNMKKDSFAVAGMNLAGVKLFEVRSTAGSIEAGYIFPGFSKYGDLPRAIYDHVRILYFDRVPADTAVVTRKKNSMVFRQPWDAGFLEYVFAGKDGLLAEKHYSVNGRRRWSVFYYEYAHTQGRVLPGGIILRNHQYGYSLVMRLKEVVSVE